MTPLERVIVTLGRINASLALVLKGGRYVGFVREHRPQDWTRIVNAERAIDGAGDAFALGVALDEYEAAWLATREPLTEPQRRIKSQARSWAVR